MAEPATLDPRPLLARDPRPRDPVRGRADGARWRRCAPAVPAIVLAALLNTWALAQNGYANLYYSAGVETMLGSWHRFFFVTFDPGGLISIDKPPLGLWVQAASAWLFGFQPLSLLLPEALAGVLAVAALYAIVARRFGVLAGLAGALVLATFPSFVAVSRDNNVDTPLILLMILGAGAALRAIDGGRLRTLLGAAALIGLAFNVKGLAAYLAVPGIALGYLVCAPGSLRRRLAHLAAAGLVLAATSLAWAIAVDATPAGQRPYVGSSTDNSELGLAFSYNGFGRVSGQLGGPGPVPELAQTPSAPSVVPRSGRPVSGARRRPTAAPAAAPVIRNTITRSPIPFGLAAGPLRLFQSGFGDQGAWLLPFALVGMIALGASRPRRRDPRLAALIVLGGFLLVEAAALSFSEGIVHPYYASALAPGVAAMAAAGLATIPRLAAGARRLLGGSAIVATAIVQALLLRSHHYIQWWAIALLALAALAALALVARPDRAGMVTALALAALLVAPAAYSATTWRQPTEGTFPAAGPAVAGGYGGVGVSLASLATNQGLIDYVIAHRPGTRFELLTQASLTAATPILLGLKAAAVGGYGGIDPALDGPALGRLVARGEARYVLIGGSYDYLGGNKASRAAEAVCRPVRPSLWNGGSALGAEGLYLLDCRGAAARLGRLHV